MRTRGCVSFLGTLVALLDLTVDGLYRDAAASEGDGVGELCVTHEGCASAQGSGYDGQQDRGDAWDEVAQELREHGSHDGREDLDEIEPINVIHVCGPPAVNLT
jgi:hypothetical protein